MVARLRELGLRGVTARTFHAHALSQLRFFWPLRHDGEPLPELLDSKAPIIGRIARQLPGHYRFTPTKDLADEIEWAKTRRIVPGEYEQRAGATTAPDPRRPVRSALPELRAREDSPAPHRFRRPPAADGRSPRGRCGGRRDRPSPQALVQRGRVPGHEPAPAAAPRAVAGGPPRPVRGGGRGPDDLLVHRGVVRVPDDVRGTLARRETGSACAELPLHPPGAGARQPPDRRGGPSQAPHPHARRRPAAHDLEAPLGGA